ncbi:MAG: hypothetical protein R2795_11340 [Saprospiraceae bacterium]
MERFISILIENTAGKFPLWLTPEQYAILPISDKFMDYCQELQNTQQDTTFAASSTTAARRLDVKFAIRN